MDSAERSLSGCYPLVPWGVYVRFVPYQGVLLTLS